MVLEEGSYGQTDILHEVQVTYQKKQAEDTLRIRNHQTASEEAVFPLYFMNKGGSGNIPKPPCILSYALCQIKHEHRSYA